MSLFTLSMTSASFLFLQHQQYIIYDKKTDRRFRGIYDPSFAHVILCTVLYLFVNVPRVLANAVILSISPEMALVLMVIELLIFLLFCHFYSNRLGNNSIFPSGLVSALANFISVTGPFRKIGHINLFANALLMIKVALIYPIVDNEKLTVDICNDPDVFRCWNMTEKINHTCLPSNGTDIVNITITTFTQENVDLSYRPFCSPDETPNSLLFHFVLPIVLMLIAFISIPFGYLIRYLMTKENLTTFDLLLSMINDVIDDVIKSAFSCCSKTSNENSDGEMKDVDVKSKSLEDLGENYQEEKKEATPTKPSTLLTFFDNVRAIFSQGRLAEENSKCSRILVIATTLKSNNIFNIDLFINIIIFCFRFKHIDCWGIRI